MSIATAMRNRYTPDAYVLMFEVANATGLAKNRSADAIAVSLWPSRGLDIIGFEFKVSRGDWLKELKDPAKAESIYRYCHQWYLVVSDATIVKHGELPKTWGQLTLQKDGRLKESVKAPKLEPAPLTMDFVASMLRSAAKPFNREDREFLNKIRTEGYDAGVKSRECEFARLNKQIDGFRKDQEEFEKASGVRISGGWRSHDAGEVGRAVRAVLNGEHERDVNEIQRIRELAAGIVERIDSESLAKQGA